MKSGDSVHEWIEGAEKGDSGSQEEIWARFFPELLRLARRHLQGRLRVGDEEDVVLSVLQSYFVGAQENRFPEVRGGDELWRLLSRMTHRKAIDWLRHAGRQKRFAVGESALNLDAEHQPMSEVAGETRNPLLEIVAIDECRRLLSLLTTELQAIALRKLEGYTNQEIAGQLTCSLATVERRLKLIRDIWSQSEQNERFQP